MEQAIVNSYIEDDLSVAAIPDDLIELVPESVAVKYLVLPYKAKRTLTGKVELLILITDSVNTSLRNKKIIQSQINIPIAFCYSKVENNVVNGIEKHYRVSVQRLRAVDITTDHMPGSRQSEVEETTLVKKINALLYTAVTRRVTDIDIRPEESESRVFFQIDGKKVEVSNEFPILLHEKGNVVRRIKVMCEPQMETSELMPQSGSFTYKGEDGSLKIDCRIEVSPSVFGESVSIRLLDSGKDALTINQLGFSPSYTNLLKRASKEAAGMFIVAGPTGSGKNTTLTALLKEFDPDEFKIMTAENPVEYKIKGAHQVQVRLAKEEKNNLTYPKILRSMLRSNPDIIMVTEIRDRETADIAMEAARTGHRIFSTVHARDAIYTFGRLFELGQDKRTVLEVLSSVTAQRLLPLNCESCGTPYQPTEEDLSMLYTSERDKIAIAAKEGLLIQGPGCKKCQDIGVFGQAPIGEAVLLDTYVRDFLLQPRGFQEILDEFKKRYQFTTMREKAMDLVLQGRVSLRDFIEIIPKTEWGGDAWN